MRILIVGDGPVPHSYMNYRADVLLKYLMMKSSHSVVVICPRPERSGETSPSSENTSMGIRCHFEYLGPFVGVTGVTSAARRATDLISMTWRIRRVLKRTSMDCIRTIGVVPTISAVIARGRKSVPIVSNVSDLYGDLYADSGLPAGHLVRWLMSRVERLCGRAEAVIVDSPLQAERWAVQGVPRERSVVLPHGLPRSLMMPDEGERDFRSTHAERFLIGYVGDIGEMDGVDIAIEALAILRSHDVDAELLIVGSGTKTYMMRLDTLVRRLEIVDRVHWVTRIENSKLPRLLGQCRVCIAPFRVRAISETAIQNKVLEYLTTDVAVVTSWSPTLQWAFGSAIAYATPGDPSDLARIVTPFLLGDEVSQEQLKFRPVIRRAFHWSAILASEVEIIERVVLRAGEPVRGRHWLAEMNFAPPHADD